MLPRPVSSKRELALMIGTQQAIADEIGEIQRTVSNWIEKMELNSDFSKPPGATRDNEWGNVQHFDIWQFAQADGESSQSQKNRRQCITEPAGRDLPPGPLSETVNRFSQSWASPGPLAAMTK
jgi:hypothetical protein